MHLLSFPFLHSVRDAAPFVLRGCAGVVFAYHGSQKIQNGVSGFVDQLGIPLPQLVARLVVMVEFGGGIVLLLGLLTRVASIFQVLLMIGTTIR